MGNGGPGKGPCVATPIRVDRHGGPAGRVSLLREAQPPPPRSPPPCSCPRTALAVGQGERQQPAAAPRALRRVLGVAGEGGVDALGQLQHQGPLRATPAPLCTRPPVPCFGARHCGAQGSIPGLAEQQKSRQMAPLGRECTLRTVLSTLPRPWNVAGFGQLQNWYLYLNAEPVQLQITSGRPPSP